MYKLLYISPTAFDYSNLNGVPKKILNQSKAFVGFGYDVDVLSYHDGKITLSHVKEMTKDVVSEGKSKTDVLLAVPKVIKGYDYVYIRYPMSDFFFIRALKSIKREGIPIVLEIPTYPYDSEGKESLKGRLVMALDRFYRKRIHKYVDRVCTYSDDCTIFGIPAINTINGYDFQSVKADVVDIDIHKRINLIAVSNMWPLHGYDRLIKGLAEYYAAGGDREIVLHIVGSGYVEREWKELTEALDLQKHVIFHGKVFGEALMELYKGQAMGVNSLAIHRDNLVNESTLKTKEYAAMGLPVLSSSYVDAFSNRGNEQYTMRVPADETSVNVQELVEFVDILYGSKPVADLREDIRNDGKAVCDMPVTLRPVYEFYENQKR